MGERFFRSQLAPRLLAAVERAGGDLAGLLARFGLPADAAQAAELSMPLPAFRELADAASIEAKDVNLGLHDAQRLAHGSYGALEFAARSSSTLGGAIRTFIDFSAALNTTVVFTLSERSESKGRIATVRQTVAGEPEGLGRQANEFSMAGIHAVAERLARREIAVGRVTLMHRAHGPDEGAELRRHFRGAPIALGAPDNSFEFDAAVLGWALPSADPALAAMLQKEVLGKVERTPDLVAEVRRLIREGMPGKPPAIEDVARSLHLTPRTLQRRLADAGAKFAEVLDSVREEIARARLTTSDVALGELAFDLGYADVPAFLRAFKRWTGTTPAKFRKPER